MKYIYPINILTAIIAFAFALNNWVTWGWELNFPKLCIATMVVMGLVVLWSLFGTYYFWRFQIRCWIVRWAIKLF